MEKFLKFTTTGIVTLTKLVVIGWLAFLIISSSGCKTTSHDGFSDEEYVWEGWSVSTNTISIIEAEF